MIGSSGWIKYPRGGSRGQKGGLQGQRGGPKGQRGGPKGQEGRAAPLKVASWSTATYMHFSSSLVVCKKKNPLWGSVVDGHFQPLG